MYKTIYDWSNSNFSSFSEFLKKLYELSSNYYDYTSTDDEMTKRVNRSKIRNFIENLEKYMFWLIKLGYVTKANISLVLKQLTSLQLIRIIDSKERNQNKNVVGYTSQNIVSLAPNIKESEHFNSNERSFLSSTHEYGHIINDNWSSYSEKIASKLWENTELRREAQKYSFNSPYYFLNGLKLIDEVITEDTSENITYNEFSKTRPSKSFKVSDRLYHDRVYFSNFDFYDEFQEIGVKFAKMLSFLNLNDTYSYEDVLEKLSKASMQGNFLNKLLDEFLHHNLKDYYIIICAMGVIKDAFYEKGQLNLFSNSMKKSYNSFQIFNKITTSHLNENKKIYVKK